jgi:hypothetical protein
MWCSELLRSIEVGSCQGLEESVACIFRVEAGQYWKWTDCLRGGLCSMQVILIVYDCSQNIVATAEGGTVCGTENYRSFQEGFWRMSPSN